MSIRRFTPDFITSLDDNEVFVFGSNTMGLHGGGAAETARLFFGAEWGIAEGFRGSSYAIPSTWLDKTPEEEQLVKMQESVDRFAEFVKNHPDLTFYVTKIGCGIARHKTEDMALLFEKLVDADNVILPEEFVNIILDKRNS